MVAIREVVEREDVVIVTNAGMVIRQHASEIRLAGRNTQGVRLIKLDQGDTISDVAIVAPEDEEPTNGDSSKTTPPPPEKGTPPDEDQPTLFGDTEAILPGKKGKGETRRKKSPSAKKSVPRRKKK
jgi:DNA gyrase/topoisomerase IV subunit A